MTDLQRTYNHNTPNDPRSSLSHTLRSFGFLYVPRPGLVPTSVLYRMSIVYCSAVEYHMYPLQIPLGLFVDKGNLLNYQLVLRFGLLIRILTYHPTVHNHKTIVLSTNC
jgi:hypothetical protein